MSPGIGRTESAVRIGAASIGAAAMATILVGCGSGGSTAPTPSDTVSASPSASASAEPSAVPSVIPTTGPSAVRGTANGTWVGVTNTGTSPVGVRMALRGHDLSGAPQVLTGKTQATFRERQMPNVPVTGVHGELTFATGDRVLFSVDTPAKGDTLVVVGREAHMFPTVGTSVTFVIPTPHVNQNVVVTRTKDDAHAANSNEFEFKISKAPTSATESP
jgi:hypothetical protein